MSQTDSDVEFVDNAEVGNMPSTHIAGRLKQFSFHWNYITSDIFILYSVMGYKIEFDSVEPLQVDSPREIHFTAQEETIIDNEIDKLQTKGVIVETTHCYGEFIGSR